MSVSQCQAAVDSREFAAWKAYDQLEPIGDAKLTYLLARIAKLIYWAHKAESAAELGLDDFRPWIRRLPGEGPSQDPAHMQQLLLPMFQNPHP